MWKELQKSPAFFLLLVKGLRSHILITDYVRIWEVYYTEDEFITSFKENNHLLEMDKNELLEKGFEMLEDLTKVKSIKISIDEQVLTVSMTRLLMPLRLNLVLKEGSKELPATNWPCDQASLRFFNKITQPALKTIQDLRSSQDELRRMLFTKDDEIEEYKSFGGKIRYTAIAPYNDAAHMKKHCLYKDNYGDSEISPDVLVKTVDLPKENPKIKEEIIETKISAKLEPVSQEMNLLSVTSQSNTVKKEKIKTESQPARKRKLNL
ncbi:uncharacterized protein LOC112054136 isoform X1 [Bicyclus anynana]|uniref:Uncharacterized protein LOC112054136 isoform X1 n=1 Tax=Bicyclus anynana TaxID=110368 RepID=A0A6J1NWH7_BICAN|nr:uncharacterized protein LOC112054136 isoform X1 [Bicyclus anynana]